MCLHGQQSDLWDGLKDRDSSFLKNVWEILFPKQQGARIPNAIYQWVEEVSTPKLRILTPELWDFRTVIFHKTVADFLPIPPLEWCLIVLDKRHKRSPHS